MQQLLAVLVLVVGACGSSVSQSDGGADSASESGADAQQDGAANACSVAQCGGTLYVPANTTMIIDTCGDQCTCTVDAYGGKSLDCSVQACPCDGGQ